MMRHRKCDEIECEHTTQFIISHQERLYNYRLTYNKVYHDVKITPGAPIQMNTYYIYII